MVDNTNPLSDQDRLDAAGTWLLNNQDKAGTPDYVTVSDAYRKLRVPQMQQTANDSAQVDPYSAYNTLGRAATNFAAAPIDLAGGAINAVQDVAERTGFVPPPEPGAAFNDRVPSLAQGIRSKLGIAELPQDASTGRQLGEAGMSALIPGSPSIISAVRQAPTLLSKLYGALATTGRNVVAPVIGSKVGSEVGSTIDKSLGGSGETGSFLGGNVGGVATVAAPGVGNRLVENYFGGRSRPDAPQIASAAASVGVRPTAGMLGNEEIQATERQLAGQRGSENVITNAREAALGQIRNVADQAAAARGSTDPKPTTGTIGQTIVDTADQARKDLAERSSVLQQGLYDRIGNAPVNIAPTYAALRAEIGKTDPITAAPMQQRLNALEQMMPRDPTGQVIVGPNGEINIPINAVKDWRSGLGRKTQTLEPVPGAHMDQIYGPITDAMRETAAQRGVPPAEFDRVMNVTRTTMGSGGPASYFSRIGGEPGTSGQQTGGMSAEGAFSHVIKGGEQNPQRLTQFEQHAPPAATNQIMGDAVRQRVQSTLGSPDTVTTGLPAIDGVRGGGAAGARNFASWWDNMSPEAQRVLGGSQKPTFDTLSQLAGAFNYPTRQTGLGRAVGGQTEGLAGRIVGSELAANVAEAMGLPAYVGRGFGMFGLIPTIRNVRARLMESDAARRGFTQQYSPVAPRMSDLVTAITAAQAARQRQEPQ